jgi:hypothetical protein
MWTHELTALGRPRDTQGSCDQFSVGAGLFFSDGPKIWFHHTGTSSVYITGTQQLTADADDDGASHAVWRWVTLRARCVTRRAPWVTQRAPWVTQRALNRHAVGKVDSS